MESNNETPFGRSKSIVEIRMNLKHQEYLLRNRKAITYYNNLAGKYNMTNNKKNNIKTCIISFQIVILLILFIGCIEEDKMFFSTPDETFKDTSVYSQISASSNLSDGNIQTDGLIISIPTEADLKSYISNQRIPLPLDISAYLFYRMDGIFPQFGNLNGQLYFLTSLWIF